MLLVRRRYGGKIAEVNRIRSSADSACRSRIRGALAHEPFRAGGAGVRYERLLVFGKDIRARVAREKADPIGCPGA